MDAPPSMSDGATSWKTVWGLVPPIVGWLVAALVAWSLMGTRVAVLEQRSQENERRIEQNEAETRVIRSQLQEIQRTVYEVSAAVQRVDAKLPPPRR
jgi:hypothetical protein